MLIQDSTNSRFLTQNAGQQVGPTARRDLQVQAGSTAATLDQGRSQAQGVAGAVPNMGSLLLQLLQRHQQLGTGKFAQQGFNAVDEQNKRISAQTPSSLIGAAPSVQNSVRASDAGAVSPTIQGASQGAQTFGENLRGFGDAVTTARQFLQEQADQEEKARSRAGDVINFALETGGSEGLSALMKAQPDIFKKAGFDQKTIEGLIPALKRKEQLARAGTGGGTVADRELQDINSATDRLLATRGTDGFIDPQAYLSERAKSRVGPSEFDSRLSHLLSPQERGRLSQGTEKPLSGDAAKVYAIALSMPSEAAQLKAKLANPSRTKTAGFLTGIDTEFARLLDSFADKVGRLRSGGAVNVDEANRFKEIVLKRADLISGNSSSAIDAIDRILDEASIISNEIRPQSASPQQTQTQNNDPLGIR